MLERIGKGCFCGTGVERIVIPKGVEEIQDNAFCNCESLKEVVFEAGSAVKKIGNHAFCGCISLKNIQFPDGLETIGVECFESSDLEKIVFPASVKDI